jgi:hypothetical protein
MNIDKLIESKRHNGTSNLASLKAKARKLSAANGHKLGRFSKALYGFDLHRAVCDTCELSVFVTRRPVNPPYDTEIAGSPIATKCVGHSR